MNSLERALTLKLLQVRDADKRYLQSEVWQCEESPSGAHHYLLNLSGEGNCKYCGTFYDRGFNVEDQYFDPAKTIRRRSRKE